MSYAVEIVSPEEKDRLYKQYEREPFFTCKADIHGCSIKLYTCDRVMKDRWEDNFYAMSDSVRSHGRLILMVKGGEPLVRYEPMARTAFLYDFDYYGWVKSLALAVAGDVLEDEHHIHSLHGAVLDRDGRGLALIAPSKTGKTTHAWGLLRGEGGRLVSDDWAFVRLHGNRAQAYTSEKNCYVDGDIGTVWKEYQDLLKDVSLDGKGRAVVNLRWALGAGAIAPSTTLRDVVLLKRDPKDERTSYQMSAEEALQYLLRNDFCNPHQLVRDGRKTHIRTEFFRDLLEGCDVHMLNTTSRPEKAQKELRNVLDWD